MREKFLRFMSGRYGVDQLGKFMMTLVVIACVVNIFMRRLTGIPFYIAVVLLILSYLRMFSRNYQARAKENQRYLKIRGKAVGLWYKVSGKFRKNSGKSRDAEHIIYKCPNCKQKIRVPKGRGMIEITCPRCKTKFRKRT